MSRKICTAGVRGPLSYIIMDTDKGVVSQIIEDDSAVEVTHLDMQCAEKWTDRELEARIAKRTYETD